MAAPPPPGAHVLFRPPPRLEIESESGDILHSKLRRPKQLSGPLPAPAPPLPRQASIKSSPKPAASDAAVVSEILAVERSRDSASSSVIMAVSTSRPGGAGGATPPPPAASPLGASGEERMLVSSGRHTTSAVRHSRASPRPSKPGHDRSSSGAVSLEGRGPRAARAVAASPSKKASRSPVRDLDRMHVEQQAPVRFICPISGRVMRDPIILVTGTSCDRASFERWLAKGHKCCPVTRQPLKKPIHTVPNVEMRNGIIAWATKSAPWMMDKGGVLKGNAPDPMELQGLDPQYVAPMPADDAGGAPGASGASGGGRSSGRSKARPGREWEYTADGKLISRDLEGRREVIDLRASGAAADRSTPWRAARGLASAPRSDASGGSGRSGGSRRRSRKARDWYSTAFLAAVTAAYVGTLLLSLAKSGWKLAPVAVNPWMGAGPEGLVGAGAAALPLMEGPSKQWWRLGSALFLPAGIVHAAASIAALWAYGRYAQLALPRPQVSVAGVYLLPALLASLASANLDAAFLACGALAGPCALLGSVAADQVVNFRRKKLFNLREHWLVALILLANAALLVASGLLPMAGPWYPGVGALAGFLLSLILLSAKRVGRGRPGNVKWATTQIVCAVVLVGAATAAVVGCAMPRKLGESVPALGKASCVELGGKWACTPYGAPPPAAAATCSLAVAPGGGRLTCPGAGGTVAVQDATPQQAADPEAVAALCASYCGGGAAAAPAAAPGAAEPAAVEVAAPTPPADALPVTTIAPIVAAPLAGIPDIPAATPVVVPPQVPAAVEAAPAVPAAVEVAPLLTPFVAVPETQTVLQAAPAAVAAVPAAQSAAAQAAAASVAVASTLQPELQPAQQQVATAVVAPEVPLTIGRKLRAGRDQALLRHSASLPGAAAGGGGAGRKLRAGKQGRR